jgi:hypothetical protein
MTQYFLGVAELQDPDEAMYKISQTRMISARNLVCFFFFTEVRDECRKQFCLSWLPRAVDFKVTCSQIPCRAFTGIRTHDPLYESPTS